MAQGKDLASIQDRAAHQHGVVCRRQLLAAGYESRHIDSLIRNERLLKLFLGVYAIGRQVTDLPSIWMAGTLRAGPGSALAGVSAAAAWRMLEPASVVQVARPHGRPFHEQGLGRHLRLHLYMRRTSFLNGDATRIGPIPILTPARVLIDLSRNLPDHDLRQAFRGAGQAGLLTPRCLDHVSTRGRSFKGHARLMELVEQWLPDTGRLRSPMESEFLLLCGRYGIPAPLTNHRVGGFEADCFWPGTRVIVELDSRTFHDDGFGFEDDRDKGNELSVHGYVVLRFTHRMITRQPEKVARILRKHLARGLERGVALSPPVEA